MAISVDQFIIQYRDSARSRWSCDDMGYGTPNTKREAVEHFKRLSFEMGDDMEFQVILFDGDNGGWSFVTESIEAAAEDQALQLEQWAREDVAHERSESSVSVFV